MMPTIETLLAKGAVCACNFAHKGARRFACDLWITLADSSARAFAAQGTYQWDEKSDGYYLAIECCAQETFKQPLTFWVGASALCTAPKRMHV